MRQNYIIWLSNKKTIIKFAYSPEIYWSVRRYSNIYESVDYTFHLKLVSLSDFHELQESVFFQHILISLPWHIEKNNHYFVPARVTCYEMIFDLISGKSDLSSNFMLMLFPTHTYNVIHAMPSNTRMHFFVPVNLICYRSK